MMTRVPAADETRALARLTADELRGATRGIEDVHRAIARRAFTAGGAVARPAHLLHDGISAGVYAAVRGGMRGAGLAAEAVAARRPVEVSTHPRGAALLGVVDGLIGDALEREGSPLHQPMAVRVGGRPVPPERGALAAAFPDAAPRLVVFLHGLMGTESAWGHGGAEPYGPRLERALGASAVYVRYPTGRHVSENGRDLAALLDALTDAWPVPVEQVALVGHSMGGLVARSACTHGAAFAGRVRHTVSLGTPHHGAPLERGAHRAAAALHALPETRPLAALLRRRSAGIRDLRHGSLVDEDWRGRDPEALRAQACAEVPLLDGALHAFVTATVTRDPRHPLGRLVGDVLVLGPSAAGRSRRRPERLAFADEHGLRLGGTHHMALLNHPAVHARLREWLASGPTVPPALA